MKRLLDGFIMSLSMFTCIPMPTIWNKSAFPLVVPLLPVVGAVIGGLWLGAAQLLLYLQLPVLLSAALLFLFPLFASGFIHLDGYMDSCDAVSSRAALDRKRAILKDSHVGAFAVIAVCVYFLLGFCTCVSVMERGQSPVALVFIPILARSVSGTALLNISAISETGFGATFRQGARPIHTAVPVAFAVICLVLGYITGGVQVAFVLSAVLLGGAAAALYVTRQLGGISGDLCGFIITVSELCGLLAYAVI